MYYEWFVLYRLFCWIFFRYHSNWTNWLSHHMHQSSCANAENFTTLTRKKSSSAKRQCQGTMLQVENRSLSNKNYETPKDHSNKHPWNCSSTWGMAPAWHESQKNLTVNECFRFNSTQSDPRPLNFPECFSIVISRGVSERCFLRFVSCIVIFLLIFPGLPWCLELLSCTKLGSFTCSDRILKQIIIQRTSQEPSSSKGLETERLGISRYFWITRTKQRT